MNTINTENRSYISEDVKDAIILEVSEKIETRLSEKEAKKFRSLYALVALISFIGFGAVTQFIDFYSTKAVDQKLESTKAELLSEKIFAQLIIMSSDLSRADSFTDTDRDTVMALLEESKKYPRIASETGFSSVLEKIIDSFVLASSNVHVDKICSDYEQVCFSNEGIGITLVQHYGRLYLGAVDISNESSKQIAIRLEKAAALLDSEGQEGVSAAFRSLIRFRQLDGAGDTALRSALSSYSKLDSEDGNKFHRHIQRLSSVSSMGKRETPEISRIAALTGKFVDMYKKELSDIPGSTDSP